MTTLYKSLVRSHPEYCCPLWHSSKIADIQKIEGVQRAFTSRIWGLQHLNYWQRLRALKLMSLQRRRERYIIIHMWKILHGYCPNDICIQFSEPSRHGIKAFVPNLNKKSNQRVKPCATVHWLLLAHAFGISFLLICIQLKILCNSRLS